MTEPELADSLSAMEAEYQQLDEQRAQLEEKLGKLGVSIWDTRRKLETITFKRVVDEQKAAFRARYAIVGVRQARASKNGGTA
ncbi:MAG: hypothetical protein ACLPYS_02205 [Vulcanimicrobiaceae bacterium]